MNFKVLFLPLLLLSISLCAQTNSQNLDERFQKIYKQSEFPGFAIGVVKNDSILFSKAYGYADVGRKTPFTEHTIMPVASISKTMIALALVKAFELNYFNEETAINDILPFEVVNPYRLKDTIKIKHLFTHTSGIIDYEDTFIKSYHLGKKPDQSLGDFLKNSLSKTGKSYSKKNFNKAAVGSTYSYSNIASALAAYLIELKANMSFDLFTQKYIFQPLNLSDTHWFYDEQLADRYATLYEINKPNYPFYKDLVNEDKSVKIYSSITYPDGSLKTSLQDLIKYVKVLVTSQYGSSKFLVPESYNKLFKRQFETINLPQNMDKNMQNQAMFWSYNSKGRLTHTGSDPGVFAVISIDQKTNIGRIVIINANVETENNQKILEDLKAIAETLELFN